MASMEVLTRPYLQIAIALVWNVYKDIALAKGCNAFLTTEL